MADKPLSYDLRRCARCLHEKPSTRENFSFIAKLGRWHSWCKVCCAEQRRQDRAARPDHYAKISKASRDRNIETARVRSRDRYWLTRDARIENERARHRANRSRYQENRRKRRATDQEWAQNERDLAAKRREANREKHREYAKRAWSKATPQRRLRNYFTAAICHSLKGAKKGGRSWENILGYSADQLREHLERQFQPGMGWDNYGDWHVDHILPVKSFEFSSADDPDFKACWALSNLRPMWASENLQKSAKRLHLL